MRYFPVTNSTLSSAHLSVYIEQQYGLSGPVNCRILKTGINDTYLVESGDGKFVFRVYSFNWRTVSEIQEELRLLALLKAKDIPVSYPLTDQQNRYIQNFEAPEGNRSGVLFSYAPGQKALNYSLDTHFHIGVLMANIHQTTQQVTLDRVTYTPEVLLVDSMSHLRRFLEAHTDEYDWMMATQQFLLKELQNVELAQLRFGAVHLDIWFDNLNIAAANQVTIFDFDFCGNGWLCLDLAYYIMQVHSTEKDENERLQKVTSFLNGYESITKISQEEKRLIPMLGVALYFFYLGVQSRRYDNYSNVFLNEVYLKRYINLLVKKYFDSLVGIMPP
jgi:Ser/Thr protein kinase RdoA (MazF antagonist)